jgi:cation transport regulator ChaC
MEAKMIDGAIVPFLSLFTLLAVAVLALISKERTRERMRDPNAPVSTLAKDGKYGGVAFLLPLEVRARRVEVLRRRVVPLV